MNEQEKKQPRIYGLLNVSFFTEKRAFKGKEAVED